MIDGKGRMTMPIISFYPTEPTEQLLSGQLPPPSDRDEAERIAAMQQDLDDTFRALGQRSPELNVLLPRVLPDGIMGTETKRALALFQLIRQLPVTGEADGETEGALAASGERARELFAPVEGLRAFGEDTYRDRLSPGETATVITVLQVMLDALAQIYDYMPPGISGRYDSLTEAAVREFQRANLLPVTGEVDKITWNRLAVQTNDLLGRDPKE